MADLKQDSWRPPFPVFLRKLSKTSWGSFFIPRFFSQDTLTASHTYDTEMVKSEMETSESKDDNFFYNQYSVIKNDGIMANKRKDMSSIFVEKAKERRIFNQN